MYSKTIEQKLKLYERQTLFVEDMLDFHSEFKKYILPEDKEVWDKYLLPDWNNIKNYRKYWLKITKDNPTLEARGNEVMGKFLNTIGALYVEDLLPAKEEAKKIVSEFVKNLP